MLKKCNYWNYATPTPPADHAHPRALCPSYIFRTCCVWILSVVNRRSVSYSARENTRGKGWNCFVLYQGSFRMSVPSSTYPHNNFYSCMPQVLLITLYNEFQCRPLYCSCSFDRAMTSSPPLLSPLFLSKIQHRFIDQLIIWCFKAMPQTPAGVQHRIECFYSFSITFSINSCV